MFKKKPTVNSIVCRLGYTIHNNNVRLSALSPVVAPLPSLSNEYGDEWQVLVSEPAAFSSL